jgi:hypothetical protein
MRLSAHLGSGASLHFVVLFYNHFWMWAPSLICGGEVCNLKQGFTSHFL